MSEFNYLVTEDDLKRSEAARKEGFRVACSTGGDNLKVAEVVELEKITFEEVSLSALCQDFAPLGVGNSKGIMIDMPFMIELCSKLKIKTINRRFNESSSGLAIPAEDVKRLEAAIEKLLVPVKPPEPAMDGMGRRVDIAFPHVGTVV